MELRPRSFVGGKMMQAATRNGFRQSSNRGEKGIDFCSWVVYNEIQELRAKSYITYIMGVIIMKTS
jgi:hypothetical protein